MSANCECILLKTKDERHFLTEKKNYKSILDFAATTGSSIFKVNISELDKEKVLNLQGLIQNLCSTGSAEKPDCFVEEKLFPKNESKIITEDKQQKFVNATQCQKNEVVKKRMPRMISKIIDETIESMFQQHLIVSTDNVKAKLQENNITSESNLYYNIMRVRKRLETTGNIITKVSPGNYKMQ